MHNFYSGTVNPINKRLCVNMPEVFIECFKDQEFLVKIKKYKFIKCFKPSLLFLV